MASLGLQLDGVKETKRRLDEFEQDWTNGKSWVVGTSVEYAIYLEAGTRHMDPKPFFQPALRELRGLGFDGFIENNTKKDPETIESLEELLETLAFALERKIKEIITAKGLIDTGTLRASIAAIPLNKGLNELPDSSDIDFRGGEAVDWSMQRQIEVSG